MAGDDAIYEREELLFSFACLTSDIYGPRDLTGQIDVSVVGRLGGGYEMGPRSIWRLNPEAAYTQEGLRITDARGIGGVG